MLFKRFLQCALSVVFLLCCYCGAEDVPQMLQNLRGRLLSKHWETTHRFLSCDTITEEGNKPLGKNCIAGLVSWICKDESTFLSLPEAAVFCSLRRPLLRGTWWQLSVDNCLPLANCCCERLPHLYSRMDVVQVSGFSQEAEPWYVAPGCC